MARVNRAADSQTATSIPSIGQHTPSTSISTANAETTTIDALEGMLKELSIGQIQNSPVAPQNYDQFAFQTNCHLPEPKNIKYSSRGLRRRAPIDSCIFEPLDAVQEESSLNLCEIHPLEAVNPERPKRDQIEKHLAGQFEWLLSCPAPAGSAKDHTSRNGSSRLTGNTVFGCNLLSRKQRAASQTETPGCPSANSYTLIATPLEGNAFSSSELDVSQSLGDQASMSIPQPPPYDCHQTTPLKVPEVEVDEVVNQAVSPSLTLISDKSSSYAGGSSRAGSFSVPRIEDSLEELDKLEDELEAVNAFTQQGRVTSPPEAKPSPKRLEPPPKVKRSSVSKRASLNGLSSTVRIKQSEKVQTQVRRSTSLVFRNKEESQASPRLRSHLSRGQLAETKTAKPTVKSSKAPTVPNFELPGEAVARRLKEQREARLAQQAEVQKAYVPPPRPKSNKPLTKPTFELPGEAISRRKREEREARLKAQEEEEKKRREFKARPLRISSTPSTIPRETIASRARQGKPLHDDDAERKRQQAKLKRYSVPSLRAAHGEPTEGKAPNTRGRLSTMASDDDLSRGTSTSAGSSSSKRNTLTAEDAQQLRRKGKQIFERDNTSYRQDKERERREREAAARAAREEAAERTRAASREWAEKKRRKEMTALQAMKREA